MKRTNQAAEARRAKDWMARLDTQIQKLERMAESGARLSPQLPVDVAAAAKQAARILRDAAGGAGRINGQDTAARSPGAAL
jgi:hypothetical protein